jgi:hypothetical protein
VIFIDHQPQMTFGVTSIDRQTLTNRNCSTPLRESLDLYTLRA